MPEQPEVRTPTRRPTPLPRLAMYAWTWLAAFSVSVTGAISAFAFMDSGDPLLFFADFTHGCLRVLLLVVIDRRLDGVLGEDRAVDLHRRERQLLGDLRVLDGRGLVEGLALHPFGDERRGGDRAA